MTGRMAYDRSAYLRRVKLLRFPRRGVPARQAIPMPQIPHPSLPTTPKQRRFWTPPHGSSRALLIAEAARDQAGLLVAVTRDTQRASALEDELRIFAGDLPVLHFPDWETL